MTRLASICWASSEVRLLQGAAQEVVAAADRETDENASWSRHERRSIGVLVLFDSTEITRGHAPCARALRWPPPPSGLRVWQLMIKVVCASDGRLGVLV
jgi:hypothetical protein